MMRHMLNAAVAPFRAHERKRAQDQESCAPLFDLADHQVIETMPTGVGNVTPNDVGVLTLTIGAACGRGLKRLGNNWL